MLDAVVLACVVASSLAQQDFFDLFSFTKVMTGCVGEDVYYSFQENVLQATKICSGLPTSDQVLPATTTTYNHVMNVLGYNAAPAPAPVIYQYTAPAVEIFPASYQAPVVTQYHKRQARQVTDRPVFDRTLLQGTIQYLTAAVSNFTCVLKTINAVDDDLNIKYNTPLDYINSLPIDTYLKNDLLDGVHFCRDLTTCLPVERLKTPVPANLQRILAYMECDRKARLSACFKHDLRTKLHRFFDLSALPDDGGRTGAVDKLAAILIGTGSVHELTVY